MLDNQESIDQIVDDVEEAQDDMVEFLDAYTVSRLQFIIDHCPVLRRDAAIALACNLKENTMNISRYNLLLSCIDNWDRHENITISLTSV